MRYKIVRNKKLLLPVLLLCAINISGLYIILNKLENYSIIYILSTGKRIELRARLIIEVFFPSLLLIYNSQMNVLALFGTIFSKL